MNNKNTRFAACSLMMLLASFSLYTHAKEWDSLQIATEGVYEPWNRTLPDGSFDGFEPEMAKVLCERMKTRCTIVAQDWDGLIPGLKAGKFDVVMDALAISPSQSCATMVQRVFMRSHKTLAISGSKPSKEPSGKVRFQGS